MLPAAPAVISCRRSLQSCERSQADRLTGSRIPWTMACLAASATADGPLHDSRKCQFSLSIPKTSQGSLDGLDVFGLLFGFGVLRLFV